MNFLLCVWLLGGGFTTLLGLIFTIFNDSDERGTSLALLFAGLISSLVCIGEICSLKNNDIAKSSEKESIVATNEDTITTIEPKAEPSVVSKEFSAADYSLELKITSFQGKLDTVYVIVPKTR